MKKALMAVVLCFALLVPVFGALAFDQERGKFVEFEGQQYVDVSDTITQVTVLGTAEGFVPDVVDGKLVAIRAVGVFGQSGSCFYVGSHGNKHLFVTNAHVVVPAAVVIQETRNVSYVVPPIKILTMLVTIGQNTGLGSAPAEVLYVNEECDLAILAVVGNWKALGIQTYFPTWTRYDNVDLIHEGDSVAVIVATRPFLEETGELTKGAWFEVRYGTVTHPFPYMPSDLLPHWFVAWFQLGDVSMTTMIYPGDSGSPVFAFKDGRPVIIGVARAAGYFHNSDGKIIFQSYFTRIDRIIPFLLEK